MLVCKLKAKHPMPIFFQLTSQQDVCILDWRNRERWSLTAANQSSKNQVSHGNSSASKYTWPPIRWQKTTEDMPFLSYLTLTFFLAFSCLLVYFIPKIALVSRLPTFISALCNLPIFRATEHLLSVRIFCYLQQETSWSTLVKLLMVQDRDFFHLKLAQRNTPVNKWKFPGMVKLKVCVQHIM